MPYRLKQGMGDLVPALPDKSDLAIYGLVAFAVLVSWSAFRSAFKRLK